LADTMVVSVKCNHESRNLQWFTDRSIG